MIKTNQNLNQKKRKKKPNPYVRAKLWKMLDVIIALLPLAILIIIQWDIYFARKSKYAFQNIVGLSMLGVFISLILARKTKLFSLVGISGILTLILFLMRSIINDLVVISFMVFLGLFISKIWTTPKKRKWERIRDKVETADISAEALENVVDKVITRSGRV
jgi:uncharacterized membrane protein